MAKLSDLYYSPIPPEIINRLIVSLDVGKGKAYTSEIVIDGETNNVASIEKKNL